MSEHTVLVTGGSGFIGTWVLRELLNTGARVVALDLEAAPERWERVIGAGANEIIFSGTPLTDRDALETLMREHGVTHVIHLAALLTPDCQQDPFLGCQVNVLGSTAVFDAARRAGTVSAIAFASSYAVYGSTPAGDDTAEPPMFYGAFKQAVDSIAAQYWRHFGLRSLAVRPHVVYGPEREVGLSAGPSVACRAAVHGQRYVIGYEGLAGYDYVEDVAKVLVRGAFECPEGASIADLPSEGATPEDFVRLIERLHPPAAGLISVAGPAIPANIPHVSRDIRRILPGWEPTSLEDGVAKTLAYYQSLGA
ncbi:MAG: NAD(P)-dependent oxidoreductase [Pirellulales bacterium]